MDFLKCLFLTLQMAAEKAKSPLGVSAPVKTQREECKEKVLCTRSSKAVISSSMFFSSWRVGNQLSSNQTQQKTHILSYLRLENGKEQTEGIGPNNQSGWMTRNILREASISPCKGTIFFKFPLK